MKTYNIVVIDRQGMPIGPGTPIRAMDKQEAIIKLLNRLTAAEIARIESIHIEQIKP